MQTKKGFIMVYTVLVGLICIIIMMYIFDIQMWEGEYSKSNKTYILKADNYQRYNEYLMTLFYTYIGENYDDIKASRIEKFFYDSIGSIVTYELAKVRYSNITEEFIFTMPYDTLTNRNNYFKLKAMGDRFQLIFTKTDYTAK
ncbi:hypothetical protein [Clostridium sp.]|uniref:hypothetical protein n=1 Tax=Clostridium sp. TaxID=1506 RepID=UPI003D6CD7D0